MDHLVLRIDEPPAGAAYYPTRLLRVTPSGEEQDPPLAEATLPKDWAAEGALQDPATGDDLDIPLTPEGLREHVLNEDDDGGALNGIGVLLYRLLFREDIGAVWDQVRQAGAEMRVHLDIRPPSLRTLPWELMQRHPEPPLSLQQGLSLVRGLPSAAALSPCTGPIRVLVVIACAEDGVSAGGEDIEWQDELQALKKTFRQQRQIFDYRVLYRPVRDAQDGALRGALRQWKPHIFHFIGHGFADEGAEAFLEFAGEDGHNGWTWTVSDILHDLQGSDGLRLAFINACHTAAPADQAGVWSIGQAFLEHGTPAVLAMQGAVSGKAAALYGQGVYQEIACGQPVDVALARARDRVRARTQQDGLLARDWSLASMTVRAPVDEVLPIRLGIQMAEWPSVRDMFDRLAKTPLKDFVDRDEHRRKVWGMIASEQDPRSSVLILKGEREIGKTTMLTWCLEACSVRRHHVVYRDCGGSESLDFLELLRYVRTGGTSPDFPDRLQRAIQPEAAFSAFNGELNRQLAPDDAAPVPPPPSGEAPPDRDYPLRPEHEHTIPKLAASFVESLKQAAQGAALTVAIDNLGGVDPSHFRKYIVPYVLTPIAGGLPVNLHVVLAVTEEQYEDRQLGLARLAYEPRTLEVKLDRFAERDFPALAADFLTTYKDSGDTAALISALERMITEPWKPTTLGHLRGLIQASGG